MGLLSIILFFVCTYGLGFTATAFVKNAENFLERTLMRMGIGLALLPLLALALNALRLPADWRLLLLLSVAYPVYHLLKNRSSLKLSFRMTRYDLSIFLMLIVFLANFYVYAAGAFAYPYLEDDDPWAHASGVKYMAIEKDAFAEEARSIRYLNPYPPMFNILLGVLHQTNDSIYWTLKFFNALIISISVVFFYFFLRQLTGERSIALFGSFALFAVPAYLSHFIWAISLAVPLYFVAFYASERIREDKRWWVTAALVIGAILMVSPTHSTYFGLLFGLYILTKMAVERRLLVWQVAAGATGLMISLLLWWLPMLLRYGFEGVLRGVGVTIGKTGSLGLSIAGTADRTYTLSDFLCHPGTGCWQGANMVNNPIGLGMVISALAVIGIIWALVSFRKAQLDEKSWLAVMVAWSAFTLYAVNAANMPIKLSPFRAWMLVAIAASMASAYALYMIFLASRKAGGKQIAFVILGVLLLGIFMTSAQQKMGVNMSPTWPPGAFWGSVEEIQAYLWLKENLPKNTKVFAFTNDDQIIGNDMYSCDWCPDIQAYKEEGFNQTPQETHEWLRQNDYEYMIIDTRTAQMFGPNATNEKIQEYVQSGLFRPVPGIQSGAVLFKI